MDSTTGISGDDDPLDACELAGDVGYPGQVKVVKVLGAFAVIDEGETDWKIVVIDVENPLSQKIDDISQVEKYMPGYLGTMQEWFRVYKVPDGKKKNEIALNGQVRGKEYAFAEPPFYFQWKPPLTCCCRFALSIIKHCHRSWKSILDQPSIKENKSRYV